MRSETIPHSEFHNPNSVPASPLRIGYVIWSLELGGAEQVLMRLASGLRLRGHAVCIFTLNDPGIFAEQMQAGGIRVIAMRKHGPYDVWVIWRLARAFRAQELDIVHTHLWGAGLWGRLAAWLARVPIIIAHEHGMQPWRKRLHFLCDRWLARVTTHILFVSREVMQGYLRQTGIPRSRCRLVPNGVDCSQVTEDRWALRRRFGWAKDEQVVVSVGRLAPEKGYDDLLRAFARVAESAPRVRLVVVGEGSERGWLERWKTQHGLNGHVNFVGLRDDVPRWLAAADLYVQPSRREGLSLATLEAMVAGLPVIATRVGDIARVIRHGQEGYLVPAGDPAALAAMMTSLLGQLDRQEPIVEAARRRVEAFYSLDQMVSGVERLYQEARAVSAQGRAARGD